MAAIDDIDAAAAAADHDMSLVAAIHLHEARFTGRSDRAAGRLRASLKDGEALEPAAQEIGGAAILVVAGTLAQLHRVKAIDMRAVGVTRLQRRAIVLEAHLLERAGAGAVIIVKAVALVVAAVATINADIGGAAIRPIEIRGAKPVFAILVEEATDHIDGRADAALRMGEGRAMLFAVLKERGENDALEDVALEQQTVNAGPLDREALERRIVEEGFVAGAKEMEPVAVRPGARDGEPAGETEIAHRVLRGQRQDRLALCEL